MDHQGFTVNSTATEKGAKTASQLRGRVAKSAVATEEEIHGGLNSAVGMARPHPVEDATDRRIHGLQKIQRRADTVWTAQMVGMIGGGVGGWATTKLKATKANTIVHAIFAAPVQALFNTPISKIHHLPKYYMQSIHEHAAKTGGAAATTYAPKAAAKAKAFGAAADDFAASTRSGTASVLAPVKNTVRTGLNTFETTTVGSSVRGGIGRFTEWRASSNLSAHTKRLVKTETALTHKMPDFFGRITQFFTGKKPQFLGAHPELAEVTGHLTNARSAVSTVDRVTHMNSAKAALEKVKVTSSDTGLLGRVGSIETQLGKAHGTVESAMHFEGLRGQNLSAVVKSFGRAVGKVPVFGAIVAVGAAAGIGATVMSHRKDNRIAREAHMEIAQAIGDNSPLMAVIDRAYSKEKTRHFARSTFSVGSDIANSAMGMTPHGGSMAWMGVQMAPMAASALIPENKMLNAYANLRAAEKTGKALPPEQKLGCLVQLVAGVPSVSAHGGQYNRLTMPVAEAIMDQNLNATETMKLLGSDAKFSALASEVLEKQKVATAAVAENAPEVVANDNHAKAPMVSGKPMISGVVNEGRVNQLHKAASV